MTCAQFHSDHFNTTCGREECIFHRIWIKPYIYFLRTHSASEDTVCSSLCFYGLLSMDLAVSVKVTSLVFIWFSHIIVTSTHMALVQLFTLQLLEWNLHQDNNLICSFLRLYLFPSHVRFTQAAWWRQQKKHFPRYWPFVQGIHRSPVYSPYKGQWRGALMFSLICTWINGWINEREAIDLRRVRTHYDVTVMWASIYVTNLVINSTQLNSKYFYWILYNSIYRNMSRLKPRWVYLPQSIWFTYKV